MPDKTINPADEYLKLLFIKLILTTIIPIVLGKILFKKRLDELEREIDIVPMPPTRPKKK